MDATAITLAVLSVLTGAIGVLYRELRALSKSEGECQKRLSAVEAALVHAKRLREEMHEENTQRLERIEAAVVSKERG